MSKKRIIGVLAVGAVIALVAVVKSGKPHNAVAANDVVSQQGIHWHPELAIYIKGQKQEIPANIGIGSQYSNSKWYDPMMSMTDFHTHDTSGTLHWEVMDGPVTKDHVMLGTFFNVWGKQFNSSCIFDSCNGQGGTVKMTVNSQPNTEFDKYLVHDKDKIEIRYE